MENTSLQHIQTSSLGQKIELIEDNINDMDTLTFLLKVMDDPVEQSIFSGLLKIKRDIGDRSLSEYLDEQREQTYQRLFR